ncbi:MAG TPA: hypothetical protein IGR64_05495 [Leptolyngbyaceae cyanobacterium M65_K2018_010]|nr:hypothetical protein [Leptolyngbyaceae cyanobacterium M65_K2018_010]
MQLGIGSAIAYGVLAILGGILGYAQARSQASLISGLVSGALLLLGAWLWQQGLPAGAGLALGVSLALVIVFLRRWQQTRQARPALPMAGLGVLASVAMVMALMAGRN